MPSIDERVVSMAFENAKFEAGVAQTMASLGKLDAVLKDIGSKNSLADIEKAASKVTLEQPISALDKLKARFSRAGDGAAEGMNNIEKAGNKVTLEQPVKALDKVQAKTATVGASAADGFNDIEKASSKVSLQGLNGALDQVTAKFSTLQAAGSVALGNIASQATMKGGAFAKSFAFGPITDGLNEYKTNLGSIQTILANTEGQQVSGLDEVNKHLDELNHYSDQTIYNFSQMAKNIGTFTAAGVDLDTATSSIKGIANLAALSGSSAEQASTAMYQLSQSIAAGKVGLQDWNSVVNAGMGGRKFQNNLIQTGLALGTIEESAVKVDKATGKATINGESFRESIMSKPGQQSWLTSEVLTGSLETFTGDLTDAELAAKGFSVEQIKSIQATAKSAKAAATEVKTLPQVFDVAREAIGSGWAKTFQNIFGDFKESKKTFTAMSETLNGFINANADARNKVLAEWKKLGGRTEVIEGIKNIFEALKRVLGTVKDAFREIFPAKTGKDLYEFSKNFREFTEKLSPAPKTLDDLKRTFKGFFAVLHIGWSIVKGVVGVITDLLGVVGKGSGGFLGFTGSIGDFLVAVDDALTRGGLLTNFFDTVSRILKQPIQLLGNLTEAIFGLFDGFDGSGAGKVKSGLDGVSKAAGPLAKVLDILKSAWDGLVGLFREAKDLVSPWLDKIGNELSRIGETLAEGFKGENFDKLMSILQTGFIGGIFVILKKEIGGVSGELSGVLGHLNDVLGGLTGQLKAMQQNVQAHTILTIATAIGVLAAAAIAMSMVEPSKMSQALSAIAIGLGQLVGALALLQKVGKGGIGIGVMAAGMVLLAGAMVTLSLAVKIFSTMSWDELERGLVGVAGGLTAIAIGMKAMGPIGPIQALAIFGIAVALNVLAGAVKQFASLDWEELGRGLAGVLGGLAAMIAPVTAAGPELAIASLGVIGIAFALGMLASAVKSFAEMNLEEMGRGLLGASAALVAIGVAMWAIPPHGLLIAAGLVVVAIALSGIAGALKMFGSMSVGEIAKGLIAMGGALGILAAGLTAMIVSLPGAAALMVAAVALAILAPTLAFLGTLKWSTIFKGLAAVALALGTLAIAGTLAAPGLVLLGSALLPLGLAMVTAGAAAYLFAKALSLLATDGTKGIGVMVAAITAFVALLPKILIDLLKGLVEVVAQVAKIAPDVVEAIVAIIDAIIEVVIKSTPRLAMAIGTLVDAILLVVIRDSPKVIKAGVTLMVNLLKGIADYVPKMVPLASEIIVKLLSGFAAKAPAITAAGAKFLAAFLQGIANHIGEVVRTAYNIVISLVNALGKNAPRLALAGVQAIIGMFRAVSEAIPRFIRAGVKIVTNLIDGVSSQFDEVANAATRFVTRFFKAFGNRENTKKMVQAGLDAAINVLRGVADGIRDDEKLAEVIEAAEDLGLAIVEGIGKGLLSLPKKLADKLIAPLKKSVKKGEAVFEKRSPSKVFIRLGEAIVDGLAIGLTGLPSSLSKNLIDPLKAMLTETQGLAEVGRFLGEEFREGLTGGLYSTDTRSESEKQIAGAFDGLRNKISEEQQKLKDQVAEGEATLKDLLGAEEKDQKAISAAWRELAKDKTLLNQAMIAGFRLNASLRDEQKQLTLLASGYEAISEQIEKAQTALSELEQTRETTLQGVLDRYGSLPDLSGLLDTAMAQAEMSWEERREAARKKADEDAKRRQIDQVANYKKALTEQIAANQKYMDTLNKLKDAGLDDVTYKKLLDEGTKGQEFANQLLARGKGGIEEINNLNKKLAQTTVDAALEVGRRLYDAGIEAAKGLVDGLLVWRSQIQKLMDDIANSMISSLKRKLGIRSPSRVFAELGRYTMQGMADGLKSATGLVTDAATNVGDEAANALTNSLANIGTRIQNGVDTDLTITPVLDLTQVQKDASQIQDLANVTPITAAASYGQASAISQDSAANAAARADADAPRVINFEFEQNNSSPKALDDVEIYRQTNNQLSQLKSALGLVT